MCEARRRCPGWDHLRQRGITATIPERSDQQADRPRRGSAGGRPPAFYRLEQDQAIATGYDKTATSYRGMLDLATLLIWL
ncbi:hypothetical protein [Nocardia sp. MW-W600-9]